MAATWKDAESVFYWLNAIGREYNFPYPKNEEQKQNLYMDLYPEIIEQAVHSDFRAEMTNFLESGTFGNIRFRYEDYYGFKNEAKRFFLDWTLTHQSIGIHPQKSYFIMKRSIDSLTITEQYGKLVFTIKDDNDRYPVVIRLSKKQLFLLKPFLKHHDIDESLLNAPPSHIEKALTGLEYCVLKYMNSYDSVRERIVYWTYAMIGHTSQAIEQSFLQSVAGNYLPSFHPQELPSPKIEQRRTAKKQRKSQIRTNGKGHLIVHTFQKNTVLVLKGEMIGFVQEKKFEWMGNPRPDLIPFIEEAFSSRKKAS